MSEDPAGGATDQIWQYARVRSFLFVFVPLLILFAVQAILEYPPASHSADDLIIVAAAVAGLGLLLRARKDGSISRLVAANRAAVAIGVVVALAGVLALALEAGDASDLSDDPLTVVGGVLGVLNGYFLFSGTVSSSPGSSVPATYVEEFRRLRTGFWFFAMFIAFGVTDGLNVDHLSALAPVAYAYVAILIVAGAVGLIVFAQGLRTFDEARLRRNSNLVLVLAVLVTALAVVNFDIGTIVFAVPLLVNRFV